MTYIGVDACKGGWFAVVLEAKTNWKVNVFRDIFSLWHQHKGATLILVDIPIGLRENDSRERICDKEARRLLAPKLKPSIFVAPCRAAVYADNYEEASEINAQKTGRRLSRQVWGIIPKIKEVDQLLSTDVRAKSRIREIHPEVCFWALNGGKSITFSKREQEGFQERIQVLRQVCRHSDDMVNFALREYHGRVAADDILDAMVAAVTASEERQGLLTMPKNPEVDSSGLSMEMVYFPMF